MWTRLDDPTLEAAARATLADEHASVLVEVLLEAAARPWAPSISAVTSMGHLRLTGEQSYGLGVNSGEIALASAPNGQLRLDYYPPGDAHAAAHLLRGRDEVVDAIELLLIRLFEDLDRPPPEATSVDADASRPRLREGDGVRVRLNHRNRTPHAGTITKTLWHHKHACWLYWIEEAGRPVKKRYLFEDLEVARADPCSRRRKFY
ncbi:MAG: hypothetical protein H6730_14860 [Deltaproteobacteria bacterium]|nr:hypothetical protein [Deltaproteobacteria bacterium]